MEDAPVKYRLVIDYSAVSAYMGPDPHPVPLLQEQGLFFAGYPFFMSLDFFKDACDDEGAAPHLFWGFLYLGAEDLSQNLT